MSSHLIGQLSIQATIDRGAPILKTTLSDLNVFVLPNVQKLVLS
jgi:hypothetical protein